MWQIAWTLLLVASVANNAAARDFFVSNARGDDLADGRAAVNTASVSGPVRTIARALRLADKGDRIIIENTGKPYHESLSLCTGRQWGYRGKPFTIIGNGAILDGTAAIPREAWQHVAGDVFRFQPRNLANQQLHLGDAPPRRLRPNTNSGQLPELEPLDWMLWGRHVYFRVEPGKLPADYPLRNSAMTTGITLYHVRHVRIENLVVQGFALDGINAHDGVYDCVLEGVTCRGNGRAGITVAGSSHIVVRDAVVGDNHGVQVRVEGHSQAEIEQSEIVDNTAPSFNVVGGRLNVDGRRVTNDSQQ